jgi:hypothetical protein
MIKEGEDVGVNDEPVAIVKGSKNSLDGLVRVATWAEAKGFLGERRVKDGFKEGANDLLSHPVPDGGDTQGSRFALALWDVDPQEGLGVVVASVFEVVHQGGEVLFEIGLEHRNRHPIHTGSSSIAFDLLEGFAHTGHIDTSREGVDLMAFLHSDEQTLKQDRLAGRGRGNRPGLALRRDVFTDRR